jgi:hypothetical protein
MDTKGEDTAHEKGGGAVPPLSTQNFLGCITDWIFALFVFFFVFRLPSLSLCRWANNADTATFRIGLQSGGMLLVIFGILWCVAFALKSTADFLKYLIQASN